MITDLSKLNEFFIVIPINPEPWAVGPIGVTNKNGKPRGFMGQNLQLRNYQDAVRPHIRNHLEKIDSDVAQFFPIKNTCRITMYFWRCLDEYVTTRKSSRNWADATNMAKALEDAIQGVLIVNDRNNTQVSCAIVEQGTMVRAGPIIHLEWSNIQNIGPDISKIHPQLLTNAMSAFGAANEFVFDNQV